jgi:hypothetical protein
MKNKDIPMMPLVRKIMEQLDGKPIVSVAGPSVAKFVTHEGEVVGVREDNGSIKWFGGDKANEAKLMIRNDKIKKIIDNDKN